MDTAGIKEVIQWYFDGCFWRDREKLDRVFHKGAHVYGRAADGSLADTPRDLFVERVGSGTGQAPSYPREEEVLSIDFTGEDAAVARVTLRVNKTRFTDVLCFLRLEGKWGVIAKMFSGATIESIEEEEE